MALKPSKAPDISESVVFDLTGRGSQYYDPNTYAFDCAIGGLPFIYDIRDQQPYTRATARWKYERIDNAREPGEQTLDSGLWIRSQTSWHLGEGINFQEALDGNADQLKFRYTSGVGVDPWTPGQVGLLRSTAKRWSAPSGSTIALPATVAGVDYAILVSKPASGSNARIIKVDADGTATTLIGGASLSAAILAAESDGQHVYVATATNIYDIDLSSGSPSLHTHVNFDSANASSVALRYAKNRLMAAVTFASGAVTAGIYEIVVTSHSSTVNLSTITAITGSTVVPAGWRWTDMADGRGAIYAAGFAGDKSSIFKMAPDTSGVLGACISVADIPRGEIVYTIYGYLGTFMAIGTSRGVRVATISDDATIVYGPIIFETPSPVLSFTARDSYIWAAVGDGIDGQSGTFRISLAGVLDDGAYPYASDVFAVETHGVVDSVGFFPTSGRLFFSIASSGLWIESASELVPEGTLRLGYVNWGTLERKAWKRLRVETDELQGDIIPYAVTPSGLSQIAVLTEGNTFNTDFDLSTAYDTPQVNGKMVFILYRSSSDASKGAVLNGYAMKAIPAPTRSRLIQMPLMCYDFETDRRNARMGVSGGARYRLAALEAIESSGSTALVQDFTSGETFDAVIEEISFARTSPPSLNTENFGGTVTVTMRTVV